ncbi:hypothetical protein O7626_14405 [Micromonospora sp. WMMD1102]|uniref:hypothetical protein n=1 Tax=Micromonospora sp. WMMD1102 TaxID=3016105 RepID=UPI0024151693|nr:hypothetical protein [Micromonospora sp. WMMD1102]MDG4787106.1 hypothetical protein [Micromonospora sp. WMMD1102]
MIQATPINPPATAIDPHLCGMSATYLCRAYNSLNALTKDGVPYLDRPFNAVRVEISRRMRGMNPDTLESLRAHAFSTIERGQQVPATHYPLELIEDEIFRRAETDANETGPTDQVFQPGASVIVYRGQDGNAHQLTANIVHRTSRALTVLTPQGWRMPIGTADVITVDGAPLS